MMRSKSLSKVTAHKIMTLTISLLPLSLEYHLAALQQVYRANTGLLADVSIAWQPSGPSGTRFPRGRRNAGALYVGDCPQTS